MFKSYIKISLLLACSISAAFCATSYAEDNKEVARPEPPIKTMIFTEKLPNASIEHCWITGKTNKFTFAAPFGFVIHAEPGGRKVFVAKPSDTHLITIEIIERLEKSTAVNQPLRDRVAAENPGLKIVGESTISAAGAEAISFDLSPAAINGPVFQSRIVYTSFPTAEVKFKLTGMAANDIGNSEFHDAFGDLLMSFRRLNMNDPWKSPVASASLPD